MAIPKLSTFVQTHFPLSRLSRRNRFLCTSALSSPPSVSPIFHTKTKFLILSDLHVKRESLQTCLQALQITHDAALKRNAGVLFLGDFWHARGNLPVEPLNAILTHLATWRVPIIMIPGNHDLISRTGNGVSLVPLATTLDYRCLLISTPTLLFDALFVPYMHDVAQLKSLLTATLSHPINAVFCHATVAGAQLANNILSPSTPRSLNPTDFPPQTLVYSGHLHRPHNVGDSIQYVGSPYQVSAAEYGQDKKLFVVDRAQGWKVVEAIPIDIGPRHFTVSLDAPCVMPKLRRGDRVVLQSSRNASNMAESLRSDGVMVEVQSTLFSPLSFSDKPQSPLAPAEPRISTGAMSNNNLFRKYATIKNLSPEVTKAGLDILEEVGGKVSSVSGKDVIMKWQTVTLRGFGPFEDTITYPLSNRGLVLITGRDCDQNGVITGRTNATGKTTLVMAALWAMTGRTDPRPDGSVEKGVSLEMVHDDAKDCEVTVRLQLSGERALMEASSMMSEEERNKAHLLDESGDRQKTTLDLVVTRTSTRNGTPEKTRSYKQGLCLQLNEVDVSCLDTKETQSRIDRLVNGTLLPHTVFFGQHMGAGRGLLDSTDRTLKDHLSLIFPLDIWKEARKRGKERLNTLQHLQLTAGASLEAAKAILMRLESAQASAQGQRNSFEETRTQKLNEIEQSISEVLATASRWEEDSVAFSESFASMNSAQELMPVIDDLKRYLISLDDTRMPELDDAKASAAAEVARTAAAVGTEEAFRERVFSLLQKGVELEVNRLERKNLIQEFISSAQAEVEKSDTFSEIDKAWKENLAGLRQCDDRLQQLVGIHLNPKDKMIETDFDDHFDIIEGAKKRVSAFQEQKLRLQTSLQEIRHRLMKSEEFVLFGGNAFDHAVPTTESSVPSAVVTCEKCLRPFDGMLFEEARSKLQAEANAIEQELLGAADNEESAKKEHQQAVDTLNAAIAGERKKIADRKKEMSSGLSALRAKRENRTSILNEIENSKLKALRLQAEKNLYVEEIKSLNLVQELSSSDMTKTYESVSTVLDERVEQSRWAGTIATDAYNKIVEETERKQREQLLVDSKKCELREEVEILQKVQADMTLMESERDSLRSESNPFEESLRMLQEELSQESSIVTKRETEFEKLTEKIGMLKTVDVAFGPRGISSFVLEEGLTWLEKTSGEYLHKLSAGELMLQIRAFSDYKSNRVDGENKEVISKRIYVRKKDNGALRERALRQLSGGQRRRCSLAFALAFADLAHERAGYQSSLVVFDEILQSLDHDGRVRISQIMPSLLAEGNIRDTILVVAQDEAPEIASSAHGGIDVIERQADSSSILLDGNVPQV